METIFKNLASKIEIYLSDNQINKFFKYKDLLIETNKHLNLTAITDDYEVIEKHFIDSLTITKYLTENSTLIDVGTGAGFPGLPVKIYREDIKITLLDSLNKRLNFLNNVINELELKDVNTIHGRAEDLAHNLEYREKFDFVTARAVANLATLSELCIPFLKAGGKFICMKSNVEEEIKNAKNAINVLGGKITTVDKFYLPKLDNGNSNESVERTIIIIEKIKNTANKYPRKAGTPAKNPL